MSEISEKPIFFDSMEVRSVVSEIKSSRDSILYVANILTAAGDENIIKIENQQGENE